MVTKIPGISYGPLPRPAGPDFIETLDQPPRLVVIHDTGNTGSAADEAHFAATRTDPHQKWTSAHAYVDTGGALGSTPLNVVAWGAFHYANHHGWHIEMCGKNTGDPHAVPATTVAQAAKLTAQLCALAGIPKVKLSPTEVAAGKRGICGHLDITIGLQVGDHDDPGEHFDWPAFITAVNAADTGDEDMQQTDKLVHPTPNSPGRDVGSVLTDVDNLRDFLIGAGQLVPGDASFPRAESPLGRLVRFLNNPATQAVLSEADLQALAAKLAPLVAAPVNDLTAAVKELTNRLPGGGPGGQP